MQAGAAVQLRLDQKRVSARTSFAFGETEFTYGLRDRNGEREIAADYFQVSRVRGRVTRTDRTGLRIGLLLLAAGLAMVWLDYNAGRLDLLSALWALPGVLLLLFVSTRKIRFIVFDVAGQQLWVIEDKRLPRIVSELETRRHKRLRELYGPLNLANDPGLEIRKIEWLVLESVLTREEADQQIAMVHMSRTPPANSH